MSTIEHILEEAALLSKDQRYTLAYRLLASNEPDPTDDVGKEWDLTIRERIRRYDGGETSVQSAGKVFAELDKKLAR